MTMRGSGFARVAGERVLLVYLGFYLLPFPFDDLPWIGERSESLWRGFLTPLVIWLSRRALGLSSEDPFLRNGGGGSGDSTFDYLRVLSLFTLAVLVVAIWMLLDRRQNRRARLNEWLHVALRYYLVIAMLSYGGMKVLRSQFAFPEPDRWFQTYGDSSPMRLLWTFMGYSAPYTFFGGLAEIMGGILLCFRRTTTLGALVVAAVMTNVVMLNFSYDVAVKIYSSHLLFMALVLLFPDLRRLARVLLLNRATEPRVFSRHFRTARANRASAVAKGLFLAWSFFSVGQVCFNHWVTFGDRAPRPELFGAYDVESFTKDGKLLPPLVGESPRWRRFLVNHSSFSIQRMDDRIERFRALRDAPAGSFGLVRGSETTLLNYRKSGADRLVLDGKLATGGTIHAELRRIDLDSLPLLSRGFHWVNEVPFNR